MKKKTTPTTISGLFNKAITAHFKKAARIIVNADPENKMFSATDGYIVIRSGLLDYDEIIRPVLQKDPTSGSFTCFGKNWWEPSGESKLDLNKTLHPDVKVTAARPAPFTVKVDETLTVRPYYDGENVIYFNADFISLFPAAENCLYTSGRYSMGFLDNGRDNYAGLLPVKVTNPATDRAVRAYFTAEPADVEKLQRENAAVRADRAKVEEQLVAAENIGAGLARDLETAKAEIERLSRELEAAETAAAGYAADLKEAEERAKEAEERADEKPADEKQALNTAGLEKLDGVTVVIKGAATNKPVAWISGDTKKHADALKKAGCKWSAKRSAWYLTA